ncbi:RNA polymerase factor sigma-54 [Lactiplantibacillus plantarum]|uniref:RNA polymerase factor sigma-54 n=1 Tax=Lactiplantibacillus plantarum TaxID=1590 RepID=UPI0007BC06DC|nr:RNA polymerase factor sigma-54 [Lactiplantibacillus plantarum]AYE59609.1 RNA polymerase factor sigma-54 [Lactiplantibacillus plantarum]KZU48680.1 RNA polymerase sigma-54 factor RpoN [Lactiplantibacillus plantarum]MCG0575778.1 RNA polymerase factor sigma-54 [Lactiplantibacillus plantarum]QBJ54675.1 RNA polymerase factor sigma-54 [Lactiplantibacillus plantarum]RDG27602.1 RNA polymerase factor sigma-54 [Lactiplantibacillus plantarum]
MALGPGFRQQQRQSQKLAMTQRLQQSIQMLQFNVEELRDFLTQKALENPLIDVDTNWNNNHASLNAAKNVTTKADFIERVSTSNQHSLFEYLLDQIHLTMRDTHLRQIVLYLIEYVDVNGYLRIDERQVRQETKATPIELLDAITLLQQLDPPGVGARSLQEALMLQTENDDHAPNLAYIILEESFDELVNRQWDLLAKKYQVTLADISSIYDYVRTLTPVPGAAIGQETTGYIFPDLVVTNQGGQLALRTASMAQPVVKFRSRYYQQMGQHDDQEVTEYLKEKKSEYDWIANSLQQREATIFRVGTAIIERQADFFLEKTTDLRPLLLRDVAQQLKVHESTISRSINGKYIQTDFGMFELKRFFTKAVSKRPTGGKIVSADSVQHRIMTLIEQENKEKPLSDQKIVQILNAENVELSRRTVAKYRENLNIPSSSRRKQYLRTER